MDEAGFAHFCESSQKVSPHEASIVFSTVVQNVDRQMDLNDFKAALGILVRRDTQGTKKHDSIENIAIGLRSGRQNRSPNKFVSFESKKTSGRDGFEVPSKTHQLSRVARSSARKVSRTIRWCPEMFDE
jgi:hypothetical protein